MKISIHQNPYELDLNQLMVVGKRSHNPKRNFLFISKVLGKHLEVKPNVCRVIGYLLASLRYGKTEATDIFIAYINNQLKNEASLVEAMKETMIPQERVCVLGFAETATGLGMAVASAIQGSYYLHTTREPIEQKSLFQFEEEHSHATTHRFYPQDVNQLMQADRLILVDDELTTGKSLLNIVAELIRVTPIKKFTVLSILDWRNEVHQQQVRDFCEQHAVEIEVLALLNGEVVVNDETIYEDETPPVLTEQQVGYALNVLPRLSFSEVTYYEHSGRFGVSHDELLQLEWRCEQCAKQIQKLITKDSKVLVLGHGEDIYIPSRVAAYLPGEVKFKSTTRSPIYCEEGSAISQKHVFYDAEVPYYFYNKEEIEENYDHVIWITERLLHIKLTNNLIIVQL